MCFHSPKIFAKALSMPSPRKPRLRMVPSGGEEDDVGDAVDAVGSNLLEGDAEYLRIRDAHLFYGLVASSLSSLTIKPSTCKPRSLYFSWAATMPGISALQGGHQLAQKSTKTYFPLPT